MKNRILILFIMAQLMLMTSCKEETKENVILKEAYTISLGNHTFQIPAEYLLDADNRKDGAQRYIRILGKLPDLNPLDLESAQSRMNPPPRGKEEVVFSLNYADGNRLPPDSLLHHWSMNGKNYTVPKTWDKDGLIHLGEYTLAGRKKFNIYSFVRNGEPIAQLQCGTSDSPNPSCDIYQAYDDRTMSIHVIFDIEKLDWYIKEGLDKILRKVESWEVKPNQ